MFALLGALLGVGGPAGLWLLLTVFEPGPEHLMRWVYGYCAVATTVVLTLFGAVAGRLMDALRLAALRDGLTGLYNRRFFVAALPGVRAGCERRGTPLSLLMLDLDRFKRVNDTYGHAVGDQTLRAVARALERGVRGSDVLVRFGGEEFAVACPDTGAELAVEIGERIRGEVAALSAEELGHPGRQTISAGVATLAAGDATSVEALIAAADTALYQAKADGRDRVARASEPPADPSRVHPLALAGS
jgi:diguanylate cyclase (GGDEF)-like protein